MAGNHAAKSSNKQAITGQNGGFYEVCAESGHAAMVSSSAGLGPESDSAGEAQQHFYE
jgi:hypothetical protein